MNLSDAIIKEIKRTIPMYINITNTKNNEEFTGTKILEKATKKYTSKQIAKQKLILQIKREHAKGKSMRGLSKEYDLSRKTISKYVNSINIGETSIYDTSNRSYSYLDTYKNEIIGLYNQSKNISKVYRKLKNSITNLKYSTLRYYISKIMEENIGENNNRVNRLVTKISRSQVIRYIFNWKYKEEIIPYINGVLEEYPVLKKYKFFYQRFREYLTNLNVLCLMNLLNSMHEEECINRFILSLKKDWEAVINAASYNISNGITEGNVNKIKQIKRDMYGRASYELLRNKVLYQSLSC